MKAAGLFEETIVQGRRRNPAHDTIRLAPNWSAQLNEMRDSIQKRSACWAAYILEVYGAPMTKGGLRNIIALWKKLDEKQRHCLSSDLTRLCDKGFLVKVQS